MPIDAYVIHVQITYPQESCALQLEAVNQHDAYDSLTNVTFALGQTPDLDMVTANEVSDERGDAICQRPIEAFYMKNDTRPQMWPRHCRNFVA